MSELQGRRLPDCTWGEDCPDYTKYEPGDYCLVHRGDIRELYFKDPTGHYGRVSKHTITEEDDGTITVSPSILVNNPQEGELFHGWLTKGVWT